MAFEFNMNYHSSLKELGGSTYEIADGQPNIKGWDVRNDDGELLGDVDELLFDPSLRKVLYLVMNLDEDYFNYDDRKVIVPIGVAELHEDDDDVILPYITGEQLAALPTYKKGKLTAEIESQVRNIIGGFLPATEHPFQSPTDKQEFYKHEQFDQDRLYSRR